MRFLVVGISDVGDRNENFEWILLIGLSDATFYVALDFGFSFFAVSDLARRGLNEDGSLKPYEMQLTS